MAGQLLLYPALDHDAAADDRYPSRQANAVGYGLTPAGMQMSYQL